MNIPPDLGVDPEAGQKSAEDDLIGFGIGRGEKIGHVVMAGRRQGRLRKPLRRDGELREGRTMQRAFDNNRHLSAFGVLDDAACMRSSTLCACSARGST